MIDLYVNDIEVGEYTNMPIHWYWDFKEEIRVNNSVTIYKLAYYLREYADFFIIYAYEDSDNSISDLYIIDSRDMDNEIEVDSNITEFHAIKVIEDIDWKELAIKMINEG